MRHYLVCAAIIGLTACGSSDPSTPNQVNNPGGGNPGGGNPNTPSGATATPVSITNNAFSPSSVSIKVGSSVAWSNDDAVAHTTTGDGATWNSGQLSGYSGGGGYGGGATAGGSYQHTFNSAGTFSYHCANHANMTGTITVTP